LLVLGGRADSLEHSPAVESRHPWVHFTNILREAFTFKDHKSSKRQSSHWCLIALFGSEPAKAAHKTLVKLTPCVDYTNILLADFATIFFCQENYTTKLQAQKSCAKHFHMKSCA